MKSLITRTLLVFFATMFLIALPLFLLPINLFNGKVEIDVNGKTVVEEAPLSLSYFIGLGYEPIDMMGVKNYYLTTEGYLLVIIFLIGVPAIIALRIYSKQRPTK
jgi:hypothetical protein